jgi:hypothetical protein
MGKLVLMHKEDMVKKYGAKLNFDIDNFDYDGEDWEVFLDELRGITFVDSRRSGYMVQEID